MKKTRTIVAIFLIILASPLLFTFSTDAESSSWEETTPLPKALFDQASVVVNNRIYVIGGSHGPTLVDPLHQKTVYFAEISPDGTLGSWENTAELPDYRAALAAVSYNDQIYAIGGRTRFIAPGVATERNTVWVSDVNPDGTLAGWTETTPLPKAVQRHIAVVWNGHVYVAGGWTGYAGIDNVYYSQINLDGSLGDWVETTSLPDTRVTSCAAVVDGFLYVIGGEDGWANEFDTVYYAQINPDATLGAWSTTTSLPKVIQAHKCLTLDEELYVTGGAQWVANGKIWYDTVYSAEVMDNGTMSSWTECPALPEARVLHSAVTSGNRIYVIGGSNGTATKETVYYTYVAEAVDAIVDIDPDTLNLKSSGRWISCYIELPESHNVSDVNMSTILLNNSISVDPEAPTQTGDVDEDGIPDLMVKFDRDEVILSILSSIDPSEFEHQKAPHFIERTLKLTGELADGTMFEGYDTIRVILKHALIL